MKIKKSELMQIIKEEMAALTPAEKIASLRQSAGGPSADAPAGGLSPEQIMSSLGKETAELQGDVNTLSDKFEKLVRIIKKYVRQIMQNKETIRQTNATLLDIQKDVEYEKMTYEE
jgi:vacuolar-type H+-ATPase subunit I/STV1